MADTFQRGDPVLLVYDHRRRWIRTIEEDTKFHCNYGYVELGDLIDEPFGTSIQTSKGKWLHAMPPSMVDWINNFDHQSQIIYEKDAAMIIMLLDLKSGDTVYEAGTGSGSLTAYLSRSVGPQGSVITHDNRDKAIEVAKKNLKRVGAENVHFNHQDVKDSGFSEGKADALVLDMGDPWQVIDHAVDVLRPAARLVIFVPTFNQLGKIKEKLDEYNFKEVRALELIEREIQLRPNAIRPATRMIGHTGFLVTGVYLEKSMEK